jgi:uridine kinase
MKRVDKLNQWNKLSDKEKSDKIANELDWTKQDQKDWEKFKKNLPKLLQEAVIFGVGASVFLLITGYFLFKLLEVIYN